MNKDMQNYRLDEIGFGSLKIYQDPSDFCYGVDAVILADFASAGAGKRIVDLGCGNGIIPIILSHKTKGTHITGVEVKTDTSELAKENVKMNGLEDRIEIIGCDIMEFEIEPESFDTVVTNPPYVASGSGQKNHNKNSKMTARHETTAGLNDFIKLSSELLKNKGELYLVHRPSRTVEIINTLSRHNLEPKIIRYVSPKLGKNPNIMLVKATKNGGPEVEILEPLYVHNEDSSYTDEIMRIYERI